MKTLLIVRHGKSSWEYEGISDIDRPLKLRGIKDSYRMAEWMANNGYVPDMIISSPAARALNTATIFARSLRLEGLSLVINDSMYTDDEFEILRLITKTNSNITTLAVFGHNPVLTNLANAFLDNPIDELPTAGVVALTFDTRRWKSISSANVVKRLIEVPKK